MKLVSIHIPKTGGTSLRYALSQVYKVGTYYYRYRNTTDADVIHGHMTASQAKRHFPDVPVIAFMRDPYEHVLSNYAHYLEAPYTKFEPSIGQLPPNLSLEEFIVETSNYQSRFLDKSIDCIGLIEFYNSCIDFINYILGTKIPYPERINTREHPMAMGIEEKLLFDEYYAEDVTLYERVYKHWA